jgi:hypothetical protein
MTDRSTGGVSNDPDGEEQSRGSRHSTGSTPPHLPHAGDPDNLEEMHSHHTNPHSDPHKLQLQQGDLRHRFEARGSPTASSNLTGAAATPDHRHQNQNQTSDHLDAAIPSQPRESRQPPETQPFPSEEAPPSVAPPPSANLNLSTTSTDPHLAPSSSTIIPPVKTTATSTSSSISSRQTPIPRVIDRDHIRSLASGEPSPLSSGTATPTGQHRRRFKSIRPIVYAIMALEKGRKFSTGTSVHRKRQMSTLVEKEGHYGPALTVC